MFSTPFAYAHPLGLTLPFAVSPFAALPYGPIMPLGAQAYGNMALAPPPFTGYESNAGSSNKRTSEGQSKGQEAKGQSKGAGLFLGEWEPQHGAEHGVGVVVRFDGDYAEDGAARRERRQSRAWRLAEDECLVQAAAQFHARHWKRVAQRLQRLFPLVVASHNQHNADHKHSTGHKHQPQPIEVCPDRTADQCCQRWTRVLGPRMARARWSAARDAALLRAVAFCVAARTSPQEPLPHQHLPHEATALELPSDVCDALSWADVALSLAAHDLTALHCRFRFYTLRRAAKDTARKESSATNTIATSTTATSTTATSTTSETCGRTGTPLGGGGGGGGSRGGESLGDSSADSSADSCSAHTPSSPPVSPAPLPEPSDRTRYLSIHALLN